MKKNTKHNNSNREIPIMPEEYKSGITYHIPKGKSTTVKEEGLTSTRWTKEEEEWCWNLYKEGYNYKEILLHYFVDAEIKELY